jgi:hypothetical protein
MGTLWKAKIRFTVPMLFTLGMYFNFLIGGISGVFLSDVPADTTEHGSFFVMAHFHYTIMGGLIFAFMAGLYYWLPKMMGIRLNQRLGKWQFWIMFIAFNSTFLPLFAAERLGVDLLVLPGRLDPALRGQLRLVDGDRARAGNGQSLGLPGTGMAGFVAAPGRQLPASAGGAVRSL